MTIADAVNLSYGRGFTDNHATSSAGRTPLRSAKFSGRSFVNVPKPGCWRPTLHWTQHSSAPAETVDIVHRGNGREREYVTGGAVRRILDMCVGA
jgi:hypothetical protein